MQTLFRALLALYLAHLLTDFVFQTHRLVEQKRRRKPAAYLRHGLVHYLCAVVMVGFFIPASVVSLRAHLVIAALVLVHLLIDLAKIELTRHRLIHDGSLAYVGDQLLHLLTLIVAAWMLAPSVPPGAFSSLIQELRFIPNRFLAVPVVYVGVMFGGGYLIRFLTGALAQGVENHSPESSGDQLQNAGLYIGWLERFLVLTALLVQSPATVGLILTAKAIARYPQFKSEHFAEYFLIGTLLSISIALAGGALLAKLLLGQFRLAG